MAKAIADWKGEELEEALIAAGTCAAFVRTPQEWLDHPQQAAVAGLPVLEILRLDDSPRETLPRADRPLSGVRVLDMTLRDRDFTAGRGADAVRTDWSRGPEVARMLMDLEERLDSDQTFAALPEGVMLNYLSRRANPTPYVNFMPPELAIFGEQRMLDAFRAAPPDVILLVHKDALEYGTRYFGSDYGRALYAWVKSHYRPVRLIGKPPFERETTFGIRVLERIDADGRSD